MLELFTLCLNLECKRLNLSAWCKTIFMNVKIHLKILLFIYQWIHQTYIIYLVQMPGLANKTEASYIRKLKGLFRLILMNNTTSWWRRDWGAN